jgi:hypothetical protein
MPRYHKINGEKVQFTAEEETARDTEEKAWSDGQLNRDLQALRNKRNALLTQTDWWGASDNTMTDEQKKYRKDLRDLPTGLNTVKKVANVIWPTKP